MRFGNAQKDMRKSYLLGATGVLVSGLIWTIAGMLGLFYAEKISMFALFFGDMLCIMFNVAFIVGAFIGGCLELLFSLVLFQQSRSQQDDR